MTIGEAGWLYKLGTKNNDISQEAVEERRKASCCANSATNVLEAHQEEPDLQGPRRPSFCQDLRLG